MHLLSKRTTCYLLLLPVLFSIGWLAGTYGSDAWESVKRYSAQAYINKYNAASGANALTSTYFVTASDTSQLFALVEKRNDILSIETTDYDSLFHVEVEAATRRDRVNEMRSLAGVGAVFTIPFICH